MKSCREFESVANQSFERMVVVDGSFHYIEDKNGGVVSILQSIPRGAVDSAGIIAHSSASYERGRQNRRSCRQSDRFRAGRRRGDGGPDRSDAAVKKKARTRVKKRRLKLMQITIKKFLEKIVIKIRIAVTIDLDEADKRGWAILYISNRKIKKDKKPIDIHF